MKLLYGDIVSELKTRIPEFNGYDDMRDNPMVYLSFFVHFLIDHFSNASIFARAALLINDMVDSEDEEVDILLDDLFLNIYSLFKEKDTSTKKLLDGLSPKAVDAYQTTVEARLKGNASL